MLNVVKNITRAFVEAFGLDRYLALTGYFVYVFYLGSILLLVVLFYVLAWKRLNYYARLMDRYVMELWSQEELEVGKGSTTSDVRKLKLERLKRHYSSKIEQARHRRDRIFRWVPFVKWWYKRTKGKDAPMYTLPD